MELIFFISLCKISTWSNTIYSKLMIWETLLYSSLANADSFNKSALSTLMINKILSYYFNLCSIIPRNLYVITLMFSHRLKRSLKHFNDVTPRSAHQCFLQTSHFPPFQGFESPSGSPALSLVIFCFLKHKELSTQETHNKGKQTCRAKEANSPTT